MSTAEVVTAKAREGKFNKNAARRVRVAGKIPAVVYGAGLPSIALEVDPKQITRILHSETGHNTIFDLEIGGAAGQGKAMIVDWQYEPIKGNVIHIDLKRIAMDKAIRVSVPIRLVGIPVGVRTQGGILDQVLREVDLECLPTDIPGHLDIDVSNLEMHAVVRVKDLPHSGSIKYLKDENTTVAHVTAIREEVVATPDATAEAAAATPAEPEVIKKGKTDVPPEAAAPPTGGKK
jgi:large subunit ribosomal protein L25